MIAKDNLLASISANRHRTFSHVVRYRTYLTPPSNPFREGKSKFQVLRELFLVVLVCAVVLMAMSRFFYNRPIDDNLKSNMATSLQIPAESLARRTATGAVNTQAVQLKEFKNRLPKLRSEPKSQVDEVNRNELHVDSATSQPDITMTKLIDPAHEMKSGLIDNNALSQNDYPNKTLGVLEGSAVTAAKEGFQQASKPLEASSERIANQIHSSEQKDFLPEQEELQRAGTNSALAQVKAL